jgi:hypothetical protein
MDFGAATLPIDDIDTYERGDPFRRRIVKPNVLLHIATTLNDRIVRHDDGLDVGYPNRIAYSTTKWASSFLRKNSLRNWALAAFASTQYCRVRSTTPAFRKSLRVALIKRNTRSWKRRRPHCQSKSKHLANPEYVADLAGFLESESRRSISDQPLPIDCDLQSN